MFVGKRGVVCEGLCLNSRGEKVITPYQFFNFDDLRQIIRRSHQTSRCTSLRDLLGDGRPRQVHFFDAY